MSHLFGLFLGALFGLWAGPIGIAFPIVAFVKRLKYRWGALFGYAIGLVAAMFMYQALDSYVFGDSPRETVEIEAPVRTETHTSVKDPRDVPKIVLGRDHEPAEGSGVPLWLIAAIPGALIAMFGVAGALWMLQSSPPEEDQLSDKH
ncbi:MAG: hypothetical protein KTR31_41330 [Myxococcales bacterium]|nr:hypothetical protein [Myxococcales bacterium]